MRNFMTLTFCLIVLTACGITLSRTSATQVGDPQASDGKVRDSIKVASLYETEDKLSRVMNNIDGADVYYSLQEGSYLLTNISIERDATVSTGISHGDSRDALCFGVFGTKAVSTRFFNYPRDTSRVFPAPCQEKEAYFEGALAVVTRDGQQTVVLSSLRPVECSDPNERLTYRYVTSVLCEAP